jgi:hypothetical protein
MRVFALMLLVSGFASVVVAQAPAQSQSSSSSKHPRSLSTRTPRDIESGSVANGVYRNRALGLTVKIPVGWVLRTEEMNSREESESASDSQEKSSPQGAQSNTEEGGRVLLAAFSRPPDARGEDVNASIVIAAEKASNYPGMKEAAQYFGPLTEVAKAQGFAVDEDPYEMQVGTRVVVRADFHKDVGTRVMRQSTLALLAQGYAVSITVIGGSTDEVEELIDGVSFAAGK